MISFHCLEQFVESTSFESPAAAAAAAAGCLASGCGRGVLVSVAGPWPAAAAAAGGGGLASSDGTRQQRQLTRSMIVWYERYR